MPLSPWSQSCICLPPTQQISAASAGQDQRCMQRRLEETCWQQLDPFGQCIVCHVLPVTVTAACQATQGCCNAPEITQSAGLCLFRSAAKEQKLCWLHRLSTLCTGQISHFLKPYLQPGTETLGGVVDKLRRSSTSSRSRHFRYHTHLQSAAHPAPSQHVHICNVFSIALEACSRQSMRMQAGLAKASHHPRMCLMIVTGCQAHVCVHGSLPYPATHEDPAVM